MTKTKVLDFVEFNGEDLPKHKFGGQPDWLETPQWPISSELQTPMKFIAQIVLGDVFPEHKGKIAYLFMTEENEEYVDGTWEPDGGENAVIIQPSGETSISVTDQKTGPSRDEFGIVIIEKELEENSLDYSRIGGCPEFMQGEEYPAPKEEWKFLMQIDSSTLPFEINFGDAGIAYVFINNKANMGKFLWQCG